MDTDDGEEEPQITQITADWGGVSHGHRDGKRFFHLGVLGGSPFPSLVSLWLIHSATLAWHLGGSILFLRLKEHDQIVSEKFWRAFGDTGLFAIVLQPLEEGIA